MRSLAFWSGFVLAMSIEGLNQDRFGSLEAYIAHVRDPGVWIQVPAWIWVVFACIASCGFAVSYLGERR